ncbi:MAG: nucleotidyltransferase domain-containing protein [Elusimicrobiota bacterium]
MVRSPLHMNYPLDGILGTRNHLIVLRSLKDSREGMSGRSVSRVANVNHQTVAVVLKNLESQGIIKRQGSAQTQLVRINMDNKFVRELLLPLFEKEQVLLQKIFLSIRKYFKNRSLTITVFGSFVKNKNKPGSDLDVLVVLKKSVVDQEINLLDIVTDFRIKFGIRLAPILMTSGETKRRILKKDPLLVNIINEGKDLLTLKLKDWVAQW